MVLQELVVHQEHREQVERLVVQEVVGQQEQVVLQGPQVHLVQQELQVLQELVD